MKLIKCITLVLIIAAAAVVSDCSKESDKQVIPGYWSPGAFRPKGIAREKCFKFTGLLDYSTDPATPLTDKVCSSGTTITDPSSTDPADTSTKGRCMAVHGAWITGTSYKNSFPSEGIALNDNYLAAQNMTMKIIRYPGTAWAVHLYLNGTHFFNTSVTQIELINCESIDETLPAYTQPDGKALAASGKRLKLVFVRFLSNIELKATVKTSSGTVVTHTQTINASGDLPDTTHPPTWVDSSDVQHYNLPPGDYILAQDYL